jgi:uncharacterized protein (TIGR00369 family)
MNNTNPLAGSFFSEDIGIELLEWDNGHSVIALEITQRLGNRLGMAHGGVIATLADQALGLAWRSAAPDRTPGGTINLNINFISPGKGRLTAEGQLVKLTGSVAFCEGKIYDENRELIASAQGAFSARRPKIAGA